MPDPAAHLLASALLWLVGINLLTVWRFAADKRRARAGLRRVPEAELLQLAALGGTPGAYLARALWRHKTRKQPFSNQLFAILAAQLALAAFALVYLG